MKRTILTVLALLPMLAFGQKGMYKTRLSKVEVSDRIKGDSTNIIIDSLINPENPSYSYADSILSINWVRGYTEFNFELKNMANETIKIIWDDVVYIDTDGSTKKVFHNGVKFIDRNNAQPSSSIIKGAKISDLIAPTANVYYSDSKYSSGWKQYPLLDFSKKDVTPRYENKEIRILLPISKGGTTTEYIFTFKIKWQEEVKVEKKKRNKN